MEHRHYQKESEENDPVHVQGSGNWKIMLEMECYYVMSESEILQKLNKENPDNQPLPGTRILREQAMMA